MKSIIKKVLPEQLFLKIKALIAAIKMQLLTFFSKSGFLASLYFCFFNKSFFREHKSVIAGMLNYEKELININKTSVLLRRNIHRLEKGLIMKPRKDIFALDYIEETILSFSRCIASGTVNKNELKWATDVLDEYFSAVKVENNQLLKSCIQRYEKDKAKIVKELCQLEKFSPYTRSSSFKSKISFEELSLLYKQRRSIRWFENKEVPVELISKAIDAASLAPSACNRQPFKFNLLQGKDVNEVASFAMGTRGFSENIPSLIVITGELSSYPFERDRHVIYIDASLAAMQLMLAFETLGLSTCSINWPDIESRERLMESKLKLSSSERPIMLLAVGYALPDGGIPYSQKKDSSLLLKIIE